MMKKILYSPNKQLEEDIREKHLIPYKVNRYVKYEVNRWYYSDYWRQCFKVLSVKYDSHEVLDNAYIRWDDYNYGLICTDLCEQDLRLDKDYDEIYKRDIINSDKLYTGAQIIYWFFMNNIDCYNRKYKGFWKFVDSTSGHRLNDFAKYKISADIDESTGIYINCKITKEKRVWK